MDNKINLFRNSSRTFISYARSDGMNIASRLRAKITTECPEIELWLDREQMVGGIGWWKQITEALDQVDILILVMTPAAMKSEIAANEWRYARQQGVKICPVIAEDFKLDFGVMPNWMRKVHFYNLDFEWESFIRFLRTPGKNNRIPFMAPDLTGEYIARPEQYKALISQLLDKYGVNPVAATCALQGPGGFGKTTIATMICHDEFIISAFDDGILWASLGETPDILNELTKLYAALTGERPSFVDIDDASIQLAERLQQMNCLIVIDDVWDPNHVRPFMRGGYQCARLITTRQLRVVIESNAVQMVIDKMTDEESVALLVSHIHSFSDYLEEFKILADRLGGWPILLKLAGSQLRERIERKESLDRAISFVNRAIDKRGFIAFDRTNPTARNDALASTVKVSLELFSREEQICCAELSVFRSDVSFSMSAAGILWGLDEFDTESLLLRLDNAALLDFNLKTGTVKIHRVLRAYLESRLDEIRDLHLRLIKVWMKTPYDLPDSYAWLWIGWHLIQGGEKEVLRQLLLDFHWLQTRLAMISVQPLLQDFELLEENSDIRIIRDALRLASQGLTLDPKQLGIQLMGRIDWHQYSSIDTLLECIGEHKYNPQLILLSKSLSHAGGALSNIIKSYGRTVETLAISPDGQWFVSGSQDWVIRLWNLQLGQVIRSFEGHTDIVHTVVFTSDGRSILSGSEDRTLRLWDVESGQVKAVLKGHTLAVKGVSISANGKIASSVSEDGTVRVWDIDNKKSKVVHKSEYHQLQSIVITADGTKLYFGGGDWTIRKLELNNGIETILEGHHGIVRSIALNSNESCLLSGANDGSLRLWKLDSFDSSYELKGGHTKAINAVAISQDGSVGISASDDKTLRVWDLNEGIERLILKGHSGFIKTIAISSVTAQVLSGSTDMTIRYWDIVSNKYNNFQCAHNDPVALLTLSADGRRLISGTRKGDLIVWINYTSDKGKEITFFDRYMDYPKMTGNLKGHTEKIYSLQIIKNGELALTASQDRTLIVWDIVKCSCVHVLKGHYKAVLAAALSGNGQKIVSHSSDCTLRLWDTNTGKCIRILASKRDNQEISAVRTEVALFAELEAGPELDLSNVDITKETRIALSPDGNYVVLISQSYISRWNLNDGTIIEHKFDNLDISIIVFDSESKRIIFGTIFGSLLIWDFENKPIPLEGHTKRILDIVILPNGKTVISGGADDTIRIWDINLCKQTSQITGLFKKANATVITKNGLLAYSVYDDTLVAYDLDKYAQIASLTVDHQITAITVTPSGRNVVVGDQSGQVHHLYLHM